VSPIKNMGINFNSLSRVDQQGTYPHGKENNRYQTIPNDLSEIKSVSGNMKNEINSGGQEEPGLSTSTRKTSGSNQDLQNSKPGQK